MCIVKNPAGKSADTAVIGGEPLQQKSSDMTPRELEEYSALRATIRERGTARVWVFLAGLAIWAALTVATAALASLPVATLLPLLTLAATFEIVFALHTGVERIGRYIQVFFEAPGERSWEHTAMAYGRMFPGGGSDPLFTVVLRLRDRAQHRAGGAPSTGRHRMGGRRAAARALRRAPVAWPAARRRAARGRSRTVRTPQNGT